MIIGKKMVLNAEGSGQKSATQSGSAELGAGSHEMFLDYLQTTGPNGLQLFITPPGGERKSLFLRVKNRIQMFQFVYLISPLAMDSGSG